MDNKELRIATLRLYQKFILKLLNNLFISVDTFSFSVTLCGLITYLPQNLQSLY